MSSHWLFCALLVGLQSDLILADLEDNADVSILKLRMKNAVSNKHDSYVCSAHKLDSKDAFIVRFEPVSNTEVAHHMNINGCEEPASNEPYWNCNKHHHSTCKTEMYFMYIWAENGTARTLPEGVGYHIGGSTKIKYIVIGMHYKGKFKEGQTDNSGYNLYITHNRLPFQIGYYLLGTYGIIPPMTKEFHADTGCPYNKEDVLHLIMYRTHSHNLGVVMSGYRIRNGKWTEIGRMSPQLPQSFYNVTTPGLDIRRGDYLVARCTYQSKRKYATSIGWTNKDEMCNLYIMFYTKTENKAWQTMKCFKDHYKYRLKEQFQNVPDNISSTMGIPSFKMHDDPYINDTK